MGLRLGSDCDQNAHVDGRPGVGDEVKVGVGLGWARNEGEYGPQNPSLTDGSPGR